MNTNDCYKSRLNSVNLGGGNNGEISILTFHLKIVHAFGVTKSLQADIYVKPFACMVKINSKNAIREWRAVMQCERNISICIQVITMKS